MVLPYLDHPRPIAVAHRGGNLVAPENTVAAFDHAVSLGIRYLETDVHVSADGVLVAFHDADLERLGGRAGTIADQSWSELSTIDLGGGHRIPTMEELLITFPSARFNIDPKVDAAVEPLADLVASHRAVDRVGIGAFDDARIARMRERLGPTLCTSPGPAELLAFIAADPPPTQAFESHGCLQIPPRFGSYELTAGLVDHAHELGLQVHVWTINEAAEMHALLDLGVDAIMTDDPELLRSVLIDRGVWAEPPASA